jgi:hypothetical protein
LEGSNVAEKTLELFSAEVSRERGSKGPRANAYFARDPIAIPIVVGLRVSATKRANQHMFAIFVADQDFSVVLH